MITNGIVIDVPAALATLISKEEEPISRGDDTIPLSVTCLWGS